MLNNLDVLLSLKEDLKVEIKEEFVKILQKIKSQIEIEDAQIKIESCVRSVAEIEK